MPNANILKGWRKHRNEMNFVQNDYNQSGPTRKSRIDRENSRWSEELYEAMLDRKERRGSRKMPNRK